MKTTFEQILKIRTWLRSGWAKPEPPTARFSPLPRRHNFSGQLLPLCSNCAMNF